MARVLKKVNFLKGRTNLGKTPRFPGISGPRYAASGSNNRRVKARG